MNEEARYDRSLRLLVDLGRELGRLKVGFALRDAVPVVVVPIGNSIDGFRVRVDDTCTYYIWGDENQHRHSVTDSAGAALSVMAFSRGECPESDRWS